MVVFFNCCFISAVSFPPNALRYIGHDERYAAGGEGTLGYSAVGRFHDTIVVPPLANITVSSLYFASFKMNTKWFMVLVFRIKFYRFDHNVTSDLRKLKTNGRKKCKSLACYDSILT